MKIKFNACPKCRGDLEMRRDIYGIFVSCIQCGLQRDLDAPLPDTLPDRAPAPHRRRTPVTAASSPGPGPGVSEGLLRAA